MGFLENAGNFVARLQPKPQSGPRDLILDAYLQQLRSEYEAVAPPPDGSPLRPAYERLSRYIDAYVSKPAQGTPAEKERPPKWWMAYDLERGLVQVQSHEILRSKTWGIEQEYVHFAGKERLDGFQASFAAAPPAMSESEMRAYLDALLREIHWLDTVRPAPFRKRKEMLRLLGGMITALLSALLLLLAFAWFAWSSIGSDGAASVAPSWLSSVQVSPVLFVILTGAIGSLVSFTQRIQSTPSFVNPLADLYELSRQKAMISIVVASGVIGALLFYVSICAGLLKGELFPVISSPESVAPPVGSEVFLRQTGPAAGADYAKLLFWSFVAGFSERFIPNTLQRFVDKLGVQGAP